MGVDTVALSPGRACRWPGCTEIIREGSYCERHKAQGRKPYDRATDERRGSARQRGYNTEWDKFRHWFLNQPGNQICHRCLEQGRITKAELVHHIKPVRERPDLRLVADNCVPLCGKCHQAVHREG